MTVDENDKQSRPENEAGKKSDTGGTGSSSTQGGEEEATRIGTKTEIRGGDIPKSEEKSPPADKMRDGT